MKGTALLLSILISASSAASPLQYVLKDLGGLPHSAALGINGQGSVAGSGFQGYQEVAEYWSSAGPTTLGTLAGGNFSRATSLNDSGWVVGYSDNSSHRSEAFLWREDFGMIGLGTLGGESYGWQVNNNGTVVGAVIPPQQPIGGFIWREGAGMSYISHPSGKHTMFRAINNSDMIVGSITPTVSHYEGFVWTDSDDFTMLGSLESGGTSVAIGISDAGAVVGEAGTSLGHRAFRWTSTEGMVELPGFGLNSHALAIDDDAGIVGMAVKPGPAYNQVAVLWTESGVIDLNSALGAVGTEWHLEFASDINASGQIACAAKYRGEPRAVVLTPVPEPATCLALGVGFCVLALKRRSVMR